VGLRLFRRHSKHQDEVGGVTSCHQSSTTITSFVDWAVVVLVILDFGLEAGFEPDHWSLDEKDLWIALIKASPLEVPLTSFNEHTIHVNTIIRGYGVLFLNDFKVEDKTINSNTILTGIVLDSARQETLSEIELIDPIERRQALIDPGLEEFKALLEINYIAT
jgi:hypothetical protein